MKRSIDWCFLSKFPAKMTKTTAWEVCTAQVQKLMMEMQSKQSGIGAKKKKKEEGYMCSCVSRSS